MTPSRPIVRYHGGKWRLAPWIVGHLPEHRVYVEPFGGGASVLLRKPRSYAEVYNDLDGEIVNLFQVARDAGERLARACELTPYAREEFERSYEPSTDALEQARRLLVRSYMGFSPAGTSGQGTGFRSNTSRAYSTPAHDWLTYPEGLRAAIQRLRGVVIENREAAACMASHDSPQTLHYVDPPYVHATRGLRRRSPAYRHEMTDDQHAALAEVLHGLRGMVVVSGYRCDLYDRLYADWLRIDRPAHADGARPRVESLWLSPSAAAAGQREQVAA